MKRFKLFLGATLLCVAVAGFSAFKVSEEALSFYYYFVPGSIPDNDQCLLVVEETGCTTTDTNIPCETPGDNYQIYGTRVSEKVCDNELFRPIVP